MFERVKVKHNLQYQKPEKKEYFCRRPICSSIKIKKSNKKIFCIKNIHKLNTAALKRVLCLLKVLHSLRFEKYLSSEIFTNYIMDRHNLKQDSFDTDSTSVYVKPFWENQV